MASCVILLLVVGAALGSAWRKPMTQGFDEVAHVSYVAALQRAPAWPGFDALRMLDPASFAFTDEANYLNHPPLYYGLLAALGPDVVGRPDSLRSLRLINIAFVTAGLGALLMLGRRLGLGRLEFYGFAVLVATTPVLAPLAGSVNNDNLGFAGGAIGLLGLYGYLSTQRRGWLLLAGAGLIAASAAKLTGLLLVGGVFVASLTLLAMQKNIRRGDLAIAAGSLMLAAAPYLALVLQFGSPTPDTPAQHALLTNGAEIAGWSDAPRLSPAAYTAFFLKSFVLAWMPTLHPRNDLQLALCILPAAIVGLAIGGTIIALRAVVRRSASATDIIVVAGMAAIAATLTIHIAFSYQRHLQTGWMMDAYPRYYLPLMAIIPIAALTLAMHLHSLQSRTILVAFLIASPIVFQLFGAPLG